jgi:hypothetical protein
MTVLFAGKVAARDVFVHVSPCAWVDCDAELRALRKVKDPDEPRIRRAFELALIGQEVAAEQAARGRAEIEIFSSAHAAAQEAAGAPVDFIATVAAGMNSASMCSPLHVPGSARVQEGDPLLCDIAVRHKGYWGDSTRTFGGDSDVQRTRSVLTEILETSSVRFRAGAAVADAYRRMRTRSARPCRRQSSLTMGATGSALPLERTRRSSQTRPRSRNRGWCSHSNLARTSLVATASGSKTPMSSTRIGPA